METEIESVEAFAARLPFAGRHRFMRHEQIVQAAGTGQADLVSGVEHACRIAQQLPRPVERQRLQKCLRREPRPAAEQVMQLGRRDAGGLGDGLDFGLLAPMAADMADGAAHHVVIGGGFGQKRRVGNAVGRQHGCLHHLFPIYAAAGRQTTRFLRRFPPIRAPFLSARAWPRPTRSTARGRNFPSRPARDKRQSAAAGHARRGTAARCRIPGARCGRVSPRPD